MVTPVSNQEVHLEFYLVACVRPGAGDRGHITSDSATGLEADISAHGGNEGWAIAFCRAGFHARRTDDRAPVALA